MPAHEAVHRRGKFSTASVVQIVKGASKKSIFICAEQLFVPEFVNVQDIL
jgi:hypothetical protein